MATIFLRTSLFHLSTDDAHVPSGVMAIIGEITDRPSGCLAVTTKTFMSDRGKVLSEAKMNLHLPMSKVDHILLDD